MFKNRSKIIKLAKAQAKQKTYINDEVDGDYDFSPRSGPLMIIKSNKWELYYFREAYREVINFLERNAIFSSNLSMNDLRDYVNSITSDIVNNSQYKNMSNGTFNYEEKVLIDFILSNYDRLFDLFWHVDFDTHDFILGLYLNTFNMDNGDIPDIINLDNMTFYYKGFKLDLKTKEWTPSKKIHAKNIDNDKGMIEIFKDYNFQKAYLSKNPMLIENIPEILLNDRIKEEFEYAINSKKYNL